jgi:hypothetical protein
MILHYSLSYVACFWIVRCENHFSWTSATSALVFGCFDFCKDIIISLGKRKMLVLCRSHCCCYVARGHLFDQCQIDVDLLWKFKLVWSPATTVTYSENGGIVSITIVTKSSSKLELCQAAFVTLQWFRYYCDWQVDVGLPSKFKLVW